MADSVTVNFGVDANFLQNVSTRDIKPIECIFDLIDNSIDAARKQLQKSPKYEADSNGLPSDYSGFEIELEISTKEISISDNCKGFTRDELENSALVMGRESNASYSIGFFGIGLKRALLKLGTSYEIDSDNGVEKIKFNFAKGNIGGTQDIIADVKPSSSDPYATIKIKTLKNDVFHALQQPKWLEEARNEIGKRYGICIKKGLSIEVNNETVIGFAPSIRQDGPVQPDQTKIKSLNGVTVTIETGTHEQYRLTNETDYTSNKALTGQYGWYFVCNDRIMVAANHTKRLGWSTTWHSDYYGFVGWVHFVSADGDNLPWDTKKTDIDHASPIFLEIKDNLQGFVEEWKRKNNLVLPRTKSKKRKKVENKESDLTSDPSNSEQGNKRRTSNASTSNNVNSKADHNNDWNTLLPPHLAITNSKHVKPASMVIEATKLPLNYPFAGAMLYRCIVEALLLAFIKKLKKYSEIKINSIDKQKIRNPDLSEQYVKNYRVSLEDAVSWLNVNLEVFSDEVRRDCKHALGEFSKHKKFLNGVVHESNLCSREKLKMIRDDTYPLIETLVDQLNK